MYACISVHVMYVYMCVCHTCHTVLNIDQAMVLLLCRLQREEAGQRMCLLLGLSSLKGTSRVSSGK